ncbi:non-ribosomal peptide synthase/polyketide synthase [Actinokineospora guangxiensis]|uniref:Non-ribosomal peptide synthase/polyketide synthase n=1 Tax=Actinokineospora guangxiensis TaxID=1490288 RepID=A0ABW0EPS1_9PSEU
MTTQDAPSRPRNDGADPAARLTDFLEHWAGTTPDAVAVRHPGGALSYADLDAEAGAVALRLRSLGVGPESVVAVALPRSAEMVVAQLGVLKAGGAFLPVDPDYPAERVRHMLDDAGPAVLVTSAAVARRLPEVPTELVLLDGARTPGVHTAATAAAHPAYVIYTSGSTGRPKGVVVTHTGLAAFAAAEAEHFRAGPGDRVLLFSSPSFDASVLELALALAAGATMVVPPPGPLLGSALGALLAAERVTHTLIPPVALATVDPVPDLPELSTLVVGADTCPPELVRRWAPGRRMVNAYGPTESTVVSTWSGALAEDADVPIGTAIPGTRAYVLDADLRPAESGELYVAGAGLARGYLGAPGLTAQRFLPDPHGAPGARMYRTGDQVRRGSDGQLRFLGRVDHQVKIRGFRIEPGEVEAALRARPGVRDAVVVARADDSGLKRLVAYITADGDPGDLRAHVADRLPAHLVPAAVVELAAFPLSANGKLNRDALPAPVWGGGGHDAARTATEAAVLRAWSEVLGVAAVGVDEDFLALGGDSILATRLLARLTADLGVDLDLRSVFTARTPAALAALIDDQDAGAAITPGAGEGTVALSASQRRLWLLDQADPGDPEYNTGIAVGLAGPLDTQVLQRALNAVAARHDALRTTFGDGAQVVADAAEIPLRTAASTDLDRDLAEELRVPFDLSRGPLTRAVLLDHEGEHVLLIAQHHIVTDGWSVRLLIAEVLEHYRALLSGERPEVPALPVSYRDFSQWQRARLTDEALRPHLDRLRGTLAGLPVLDLPTDRPRPRVRSKAGAAHRTTVGAALTDALARLARNHDASLFTVLAAAVQVLLARYSGQRDVAVGTITAGRDRPEVQDLLGFFVNTAVLRSDVDNDLTVADFLAQVREAVLGVFEHAEVPFDRLVDELRPERDPGRTPLVQALVLLQQPEPAPHEVAGLRVRPHPLPRPASRFDVVFEFTPSAEALELVLEYDTALFEPATAERVAEHLTRLLAAFAAAPRHRLGELSLLADDERDRIVTGWNPPVPVAEATIPELFAAQAAATPEAPAVGCDGTVLTYRELDERSNQLARLLIERGAGPERFVAVALPRTPELIVALFAVLKAGAAYQPIDLSHPPERVAALLADTRPLLTITAERLPGDTLGPHAPGYSPAPLTDVERRARLLPAHPAYVIHTSGSTGRPKGVVVTHASVADLARWAAADLGPALARVAASTSLNFDVSVFEVFTPLLAGGRIELVRDVLALGEGAAAEATLVSGVPSAFTQMLAGDGLAARPAVTVLAGEALPPHVARQVADSLPGTRVANIYGPTEATVYATAWYAPDGPTPDAVPIGKPITGTRAYVLDADLRPVPVGVPGELHLGGRGLARGYLDQAGLTAERFIADPHGEPGDRMYRTGDVVRWTADGDLRYLGRADHQVKIRGFRVELGEIDAALVAHDAVTEAATVAREDGGHRRLVSYVVGSADADELRAHLARRLPEYMVPAAIVGLDALPLNPNGKLDRRALPAPDFTGGDDHVAPRTETERVLARVWAEVLGLPRVGVHDNFFLLGGDSILGLRVAARAREAGLRVIARDLFLHQTIAALAPHTASADEVRAEQGPVTGDAPLTPVQHWMFATTGEHPGHFAQSIDLAVAPGTDPDALRGALAALLEHHDALRTRFTRADGRWSQRTADPRETPAPSDGTDDAGAAFDIEDGPLVRAVLDGERLTLAVHHLVVDTVSWRLLLEDLGTAYAQIHRGEPVRLPAKTTPFRDWARALDAFTRSGGFAGEQAHWARTADPALPVDRPGAALGQASVTARLGREETTALLQRVPEAYRTRVNDVLLAGLGRVLADWTGRDGVPVMLEGHGREDDLLPGVDLSRTVGWFTAMHPFVVRGHENWAEAITSTKEALRAVPRHGIGHAALRHIAEVPCGAAPRISFNYLGDADLPDTGGLVTGVLSPLELRTHPDAVRPHLIDVVARVDAGELEATWFYSPGVHDESTVAGLARGLVAALAEIVAHCATAGGRTPSDFPLARLSQSQVDSLVGDGRDVEDLFPLSPTQAGMVFHRGSADADAYLQQIEFVVDADAERLAEAWRAVARATPALRTELVWDGVAEPLQLVRRDARLPVRVLDWTGATDADVEAERAALRAEDRATGIDLAAGPLSRVVLARLSPERTRVLWTFHHVVLDGWSLFLVLSDLLTALRGGTPPPRPPFGDHIAWLARQDIAAAEAHWRAALAGIAEPTALPFDRPPAPDHPAQSSARADVRLDRDTTAALTGLAQRGGLTLGTVLRGAWALLLAHHEGPRPGRDRDVVFGTTVSGRPAELPGVESMAGMFITTVPTRVRISPDEPLLPWLRALQHEQNEAQPHEHLPLARVRAGTDLPDPLFHSILVVENYPVTDHDLRELTGVESTNFPLALVAYPDAELGLSFGYDPALFDAATIARLAGRMLALLRGIAAGPDRAALDIPVLDDAEAATLARWHGEETGTPAETVTGAFAERVRRAPDAAAVVADGVVISSAALAEDANRLAHRLLALGVRPEDRVALLLRRSPAVVLAELAVLTAGGAYLPLDATAPVPRTRDLARAAGVRVVITDAEGADTARRVHTGPIVLVDDPTLAEEPAGAPDVPITPDSLAYVMYTSGSTGTPKGVAVRHRDIVALARDDRFAGDAHQCTLLHSALAFDATTYEAWVPLLRGGRIAVAPPGDVEPALLRSVIPALGVTALWLTAGLFRVVAEDDPGCLAGLGEVWTGGDVVPAAAVRAVLDACPGITVVDGYGPTETTTFATCHPMTGEVPENVPIGRPLNGMRAYVLDADRRLAPIGAPGELYLAGTGLARGYLGQPGLTAERFTPDPFTPGERAYRTGDVVRWGEDGVLRFLGRADDQVKVRGFRIEPGEVEAALLRHPEVTQAVVVAHRRDGRTRLAGYVVPATADPAALRGFLTAALPDYLVPAAIVPLAALPLTANAKVDRRALPEPDWTATATAAHVAPSSDAERVLAGIWAGLLGLERIGALDNFFEIGGDSILGIQMVSRARAAGWALTARDVFAHPALADLAAAATPVGHDGPRAEQGRVSGPAPLTPIQHWFLDADNPDHAVFTQSVALDLAADVDPVALGRALTVLIGHHDALRTRFTRDGDRWRQTGTAAAEIVLETADGTPDEVAVRLAERLDLASGPLVLAALLPGPVLVLVVHHLVVDGVSWRVLLEDLATAYRQETLPAKTTSFRDWARALEGHARAGGFADELPRWRGLDTDPALPADGPGAGTVEAMGQVTVRLDAEHTAALLSAVPAAYRTRVDEVLLAALGRALTDWSGRDRVLIDVEGHGREEDAVPGAVDLSRTVGWFTSIYPVALHAHADWASALKSTKEALRAIPRRGVGHGALRHLAGALPEPAPRISFNYLGQFDWSGAGLITGVRGGIGGHAHPGMPRAHQLDLVCHVLDGELEFTWYHDRGIHRAETVGGLAEAVLAALRGIVAHCAEPGAGGRTPSDFPLARLTQSEVDGLVGGAGAVEDVYPLTPMQAGMVFHSLVDGAGEAYFNQVVLTLDGIGDPEALAEAWRAVVAANPVLRSRMVWEGVAEPVQVVRGDAVLPVALLDFSGQDHAAALERHLAEDRALGVDLTAPPLMRVAIAPGDGGRATVVWTFHHVLLDGWSAAEVFAEVCARYAGHAVAARRPFRDYLSWLAGRDHAQAERFWRAELAGLSPTPLPYDRRPVEAHRASSGRTCRLVLPAATAERLRAQAQRHGLTASTVVQGAWGLLLARFAGTEDVVFGTTVSGRPADLPGVESMVGLFINTVPTRLRVRRGMGTAAWLAEVQARQAEARRHDHAALNQLRAWGGVGGGANLFDSIVVFENYPFDPEALAATGVRLVGSTDTEPTNYPISVVVRPGGDGMVIDIDHDPDLFDESTARGLAEHLELLLTAVTDDPTTPVGALPVFTDAQARMLSALGGLDNAVPPPDTVTARWAAVLAADPAAPAVTAAGVAWTRAELDQLSGRLASRLLALGVSAEQPVALLAERSPWLVVAELAILKAGGAYLPLDLRAPRSRLREVLEQSGTRVLLTDTTWAGVSAAVHSGHVQLLHDVDDEPAEPVRVAPDSLAYVMYTSGSTGVPKGVAVRHRDITALADDSRFAGPAHECVLLHSPLAFDATTYELWAPLLRGGRVAVAPAGDLDPSALRQAITAHGVTGMWLTAGLFRVIADDDPACLAGLGEVWTGGDVVPAAAVRAVLDACPGITVVDGYGPTETTTFATAYRIPREVPDSIPIGSPLDGVRASVRDAELRPVPVGAPGELCLGGAGLARGYLGRPGLTAERFVPDPSGAPGERLYRTGDVVAWTGSGELRFLGRVDDQVKIRGFRIEPGEVEAALAAHPAVTHAVVIVRAEGRSKRLVAYAVAEGVDGAALKAHLAEQLPDYMVPSVVVPLAEFPLTPNGKVDRKALPEPAAEARAARTAPRTRAETTLAQVWAGVLGVEQVGVEEDFFALGGDSILSIQVVSRARAQGLRITPRQVFDHPTVAGLAAVAQPLAAEAERGPVSGDAPLTPVQRWFFATIGPDPTRFDQSMALTLAPGVDTAALRRALNALACHHDALRMRYTRTADGWRQHNAAPGGDIALGETGVDLADGPLLTAELSEEDSTLRLAVHHLVTDGVSWRVLLEDLDTAYRQAAAGKPIDLGPRTTSFRDWARLLSEHARAFTAELPYWRSVIDGADPALPRDADGRNTSASTREHTVWLDTDETRALLREVPRAYHTRVNDVLLTALGMTLTDWSGHERVLVEVEGHGREEDAVPAPVDLSRTVGWFTSMFPVALSAHGDIATALRTTKEDLRAMPRNGVGYGVLRHLTGDLAAVPEQAVGFNYLGQFDWSGVLGGLITGVGGLESDVSPDAERPHLLDVVARVDGDRMGITWLYSDNVHHIDTVRRLARGLAEALRRIIAHCAAGGGGHTPSDFPLARLDQSQVDALTRGRAVLDVYPLTPMQAGMVVHGLSQAEQGVYLEQVTFVLDGVDGGAAGLAALADAWRHTVAHTPVLRTAIAWHGLPEPVQVVHRRAELPVAVLDWTGQPQEENLRALLAEDKARGIDLTAPPLLRVTLARVSATEVRVLWTFHHVLLDGWSVFHVLGDVLDAYRSLRAGTPPVPAERPPFRDHVRWLAEQDDERAAAHWAAVMAGFAEPTPLPLDRRPGPGHAPRSSSWTTEEMGVERTAALTAFARDHGLTLNALVQGAWALLLSAHSGHSDVCFGATAAGRPPELPGVDRITGIFITTTPVRVRVPAAVPVARWLRTLQTEQAAARSAQHVPLAVAQAGSDLAPGAAAFDSIVVFENYPVDAESEAGPVVRDLDARETTNYPLTLVAAPGERLGVQLGFDPDLVSEGTARRLCGHVLTLLEEIAAHPNAPLGSLDLRPSGDRARLADWSGAAVAGEQAPPLLPELIAEQAARTPDALALLGDQGELTYRDLDTRANRLAHLLAARGAGPERIVALALPRSVDIVVAQLAAWKAGAAYLPVDPAYPAERITAMLTDAAPLLVLTDADTAPVAAQAGVPVLVLAGDTAAEQPDHAPRVEPRPDDPAYVIYTSGSTGRPKGVTVTHRGLPAFAAAERAHLRAGPGDRVLQFSSPSFDASVLELCLALPSGAALVVPPAGPLLGEHLAEVLTRWRVTHALIPPVALATLPAETALPDLRTLVSGGEACTPELVRRWAPNRRMVNAYGPTESTVVTSWSAPLRLDGGTPIGRPLPGTRVHVLDAALRPVPVGVPGELFVAGIGLARGYLNRPGLTADRFVPDPDGPAGSRMYRTGDRVRWSADGVLEFLGRTDHQVKVRGFRVEPGEVEARLRELPGIDDAVVVVSDQRLIAYATGPDPDPDGARAALARTLPDYLVPAVVVPLAALPLSPNGKLDRAALPEPVLPDTGAERVAPRTDTEEVLALIWAEVLELPDVGVTDSFVDLGGDSVRALRVGSRAREAFDVALTPRDVLTARTIAALADVVEDLVLADLELAAATDQQA